MDFSTRIKDLCKERGMLVKDLAEKLGITSIGLSKTINQPYPQLQTLERIANALEVPITELFAPPVPSDFLALVRDRGETHTFTNRKELKNYVQGLPE